MTGPVHEHNFRDVLSRAPVKKQRHLLKPLPESLIWSENYTGLLRGIKRLISYDIGQKAEQQRAVNYRDGNAVRMTVQSG